MAINKLFLENDGLVVGTTQLVASGGGVYIGQNLAVNGNVTTKNLTITGNIINPIAISSNLTISSNTASTNTTTGALVVTGGVGISGALNATSKSFVIPHPTKEGQQLRYGSLEGPEFGVYVRGELVGYNVIKLPDYWTKLVDPKTITVQITPIGHYQRLFVNRIKDLEIVIKNDDLLGIDSIHCYYVVYAERADIEPLIVEGE